MGVSAIKASNLQPVPSPEDKDGSDLSVCTYAASKAWDAGVYAVKTYVFSVDGNWGI